jgi:hypothetical protein
LTFDGTNLGVGVASPGQLIDGAAANPRLRLTATSTGYAASQFANSSGASYFGRDNSAGSFFGIANGTVVYSSSNDPIGFFLGASEQMRLTSTGLGIGTSSPNVKLQVIGSSTVTDPVIRATNAGATQSMALTSGGLRMDGTANILINQGGSTVATIDTSGNLGLGVTPSAWNSSQWSVFEGAYGGALAFYKASNVPVTVLTSNAYNDGSWKYKTTDPALQYEMDGNLGIHKWYTAPSGTAGNAISFTQAMTLDASGRLGIGVTSPVTKLQVNVASDTSIHCYSPSANVAQIASLNDAGNNSKQLNFDGNPLVFKVADAERARINSSGNLLVGASTSDLAARIMCIGSNGLAVQYGASSGTNLQIIPGDANGNVNLKFDARSGAYPAATFWTSDLERARITSGGDLLVACTSFPSGSSAGFGFNASQYAYFSRSSGESLNLDRFTTEGKTQVLRYAGTEVGNISVTASATAYNTSSDYRLKDKPQPLTGSGAFIDSLKPKTWAWKSDGSKGVGFIAHEVQEVSPGSVVGEKDAVDAEGNPVYQAMEYGSAEFIANIIAELQSLRARVAQLEAK